MDLGQESIAWTARKYGAQSVEEAWLEFNLDNPSHVDPVELAIRKDKEG